MNNILESIKLAVADELGGVIYRAVYAGVSDALRDVANPSAEQDEDDNTLATQIDRALQEEDAPETPPTLNTEPPKKRKPRAPKETPNEESTPANTHEETPEPVSTEPVEPEPTPEEEEAVIITEAMVKERYLDVLNSQTTLEGKDAVTVAIKSIMTPTIPAGRPVRLSNVPADRLGEVMTQFTEYARKLV